MTEAHGAGTRRFWPGWSTATAIAGVLALEGFLVVEYAARPSVQVTNPLIMLYPFVWINVGVLAVITTRLPDVTDRRRYLGLAIAVGYFVVLAYFGGLFGTGSEMVSLHISWSLPPGYSPALLYDGSLLRVVIEPYKLVGYVALSYLVYATVLDAAGSALSGVVGLFSCVSCTWPIIGTIATGVFGGTSAVAAVALGQAYGLSTLVFLSAVLLLWWRPTL